MMEMINCFIPFLSLSQTGQAVRALRQCGRVKNIYLLATEKGTDEVEGCEILMIDSPASTATIRTIALHYYILNIRLSGWGSSLSNACRLLLAIRMPECFMQIVTR